MNFHRKAPDRPDTAPTGTSATARQKSTLSAGARRFLFREVAAYWPRYLGFFVMSFVGALIELSGIALVFPLLVIMVAPERIDSIHAVSRVMDYLGITRESLPPILFGLIAVLLVAKNGFMLLLQWLTARALAAWKSALSRRLISMYLYSDYSTHLAKTSSEIIRNLSLAVQVYDQFIEGVIRVVVNGLVLAAVCGLLFYMLPPAARFGLLLIGATAVVLYYSMRRQFERIGKDLNALYKSRQSIMKQAIGLIKETKLRAKEKYFIDNFTSVEKSNFEQQAFSRFMSAIPAIAMESAVIVAVLSIVAYLLFFGGQQEHGIALLGLMVAGFFRLTPVLNRMLAALRLMNISRNAVEIIASELDELEPRAHRYEVEPAPLPFERVVRMEGVGFSYPGSTLRAVRDINIDIRKGEMIGITGPSGSGKSTLVALLMGLVQPSEGRVIVDDTPLDTPVRIRAWHRRLGYVPQSVFLMEDTIARNVAFAAGEVDEARVMAALEAAQLRQFVEGLPRGIHENVGEEGVRFSGGQRHRTAIARVLYDEPEFLILDEATASLDSGTERDFTDELQRLRGRTLVLIAHRLSTLRDCDRIIFLENGTVTDMGSFDELCERCPPFRRLADLSRLQPTR